MCSTKSLLVFTAWTLLGLSSVILLYMPVSMVRPAVMPIYPSANAEHSELCDVNCNIFSNSNTIYFITPTYPRREQVAELTRLSQTLILAGNVHWIIAEDAYRCSPMVSSILARSVLPYTHLVSPMPPMYRKAKLEDNPRGVSSRRAGLAWVMDNVEEGVIYFGDDDNTYDTRLFQQIALTRAISMFPVGLAQYQGVSSPIVQKGRVVGFSDSWFAQRKFPVDMAGFAISLQFLRKRNPRAATAMPYKVGYEEDLFLQSLNLTLGDIEPLASDCTEILVWHRQGKSAKTKPRQRGPPTDLKPRQAR